MLFKKKAPQTEKKTLQEKKQQSQAKKTIQDLIPLKDLEQGLLITPDLKMVRILKVSGVNLELMSHEELNDLLEAYEGVLMNFTYPVQTINATMPIDLKSYIDKKERKYKKETNPYKRRLQQSYLEYTREIETSQDIKQRQRYLIFAEQMKEDTPKTRYETILDVDEKSKEIIDSLSELDLTAEPITDLEVVRYLHTLFDYQGALHHPIQNTDIPDMITGGNTNETKSAK